MTVPPPPPPDEFKWGPTPAMLFNESPSSSSRIPVDFSPPLIAMVVIVITAFVIITYFRLISRHLLPPIIHLLRKWRIRWRLYHRRRSYNNPSTGEEEDIESPPSDSAAFHYLSSSYGLDDSLIKTIPISIYTAKTKTKQSVLDCAVCLVEFEENDYIRTLPICSHSFHVDCIDIWLRSHANCPLCRGGIFSSSSSPFIPLMASRIRPRIEDIDILQSILSESTNYDENSVRNDSFDHHCHRDTATTSIINEIDFNSNNRNLLLKRSYSFGFERNLLPSSSSDNRLLSETATTSSPWRRSFWSKRTTSPFSCTTSKSRVFSLRYYRGGIKSPFFRRSRGSSSFFPLSESNFRYGGGGGGGYSSSRRSKSMTSPFFMRSSAAQPSSRLRCGDPEALLSPERLSRR